MTHEIMHQDGRTGPLARYDISRNRHTVINSTDDDGTTKGQEDHYIDNSGVVAGPTGREVTHDRLAGNFRDRTRTKREALAYALAQDGPIALEYLSPDLLAGLVIDQASSYSLRERAFDIIENLDTDQLEDEVLERLIGNAEQKYRDWARNELEGRRQQDEQNRARRTYILPMIDEIIESTEIYEEWDVWSQDPFNPGMFFTAQDLIKIARDARLEDNSKEAVRMLEEKNLCEMESGDLETSPAANKVLTDSPYPHYWNMVLISGLQPYRDEAAEKMLFLAKYLPDSSRVRNAYERILQGGSPPLKDRAARFLMAFGLSNLTLINLRYLTLYARGEARDKAIGELRNREVTDPDQRRNIMGEIARCSQLDPEMVCADI